MMDEEREDQIRKRYKTKGYWSHTNATIFAKERDETLHAPAESDLLEEMGKKGYELVQILPEWRENPARAGVFSNPPIEIRRYTYYFKRWFEY